MVDLFSVHHHPEVVFSKWVSLPGLRLLLGSDAAVKVQLIGE